MRRALVASACGLLLLACGCGDSDKTAQRKTACAKAASARYQYRFQGAKVGLNFLNAAGDKRVIAAAGVYRERLDDLEPSVSDSERTQLIGLDRALSQQQKLLAALAAHNLPLAHQYATIAFERELDAGQAAFVKICKVPTS